MIYIKTIFGNVYFSPFCACMIIKKGLETKFPHMGQIVNIFYVIYMPWENLRQSIAFIKKNFLKNLLHSDYIHLFIIGMRRKIIINSKYYSIFTQYATIWQWKSFTWIKSTTISRLTTLVKIGIFGQLNSMK